MRTYYRGPDAAVTEELFIWQSGPVRTFVLVDLRDVGRVEQEASRLGRVIAALLLAVAGGVWVQLALPGRWYAGVGALIAALAILVWPPRTRRWMLRAAYRGDEVTLYSSVDPRVFNQVTRALRRAMEDARLGR
ncbi:DUF6232 family protein [Amorphoplanes digitatis]|uniref:Uncharacterized protein n=1 Tax=Actinoplanes digitatis TaxID=1868 RepID=A0A7W7HZ11_9ACTN|nr:DUF6232 family protein [Actinoplanes digitatis]MBB4763426.1 hypothetical protein [Actinoplanes digitatis]BFE72529.1 hypothetical protein GCM10020092_058300 [Actinoplanes digitatis]GID92245.1 hypothetical protein Adi01nite_16570 [Actinoplanes digitatis]